MFGLCPSGVSRMVVICGTFHEAVEGICGAAGTRLEVLA